MVVAAIGMAYAWPMQITGYNQNAHYALTKALARGTPYIDGVIGEIGELSTGDAARHAGHLYAVKAPGLAAVSVPPYVALEAVGARTTGDPTKALWVLHLVGAVMPAVALVLFVLLFGERAEPGYGLAGATIFAVGTLLLPFATLYFAHALSAAFGFAAFFVLWRERAGSFSAWRIAFGGLLAGLAIVAEYQLWVLAVVLAAYAAASQGRAHRLLAYTSGVLAGLLPLAAFHLWAFGSPFHTPYTDYWSQHGASGRQLTLPNLDRVAAYLFDAMGLLVLTPVVVCGVAGSIVLYRRGWRAEMLVVLASTVAYGVYFARLGAFGGLGPPRYLVVVLPFVALGFSPALRAFPLTTIALGAISAFQMIVMTATGPLAAYDGQWLARLRRGDVMQTAASLVDVTGGYTILPLVGATALAIAGAAVASDRVVVTARDAVSAAVAVLAWAVCALRAQNDFGAAPSLEYVAPAVVVVGVLCALVAAGSRSRVRTPDRAHAAPGLGS